MADYPPILDGHNDVLLRLWKKPRAIAARDFLQGDGEGQMDYPRMRQGSLAGGFFAIFAPPADDEQRDEEDLNPPIVRPLSYASALRSTLGMLDVRDDIISMSNGSVALCLTVADMRAAMTRGALALITHIEGAEAILPDLSNLQEFYDRGLRSIGPVWSRKNAFGDGVPFRFPSSPDTGGGLTDAGVALVKECNRLRMMVDLSHITEKGFWDVARTSNAPLVATHSNAHALSASSRNLTNEQLLAIRESRGMVGLNYATGFLRDDGRWNTATEPDVMVRHLEHLMRFAGEDSVGLGSDFDGARIPGFINDCAGTPRLIDAMRQAGFGEALIEKIAYKNWLRVLELTWGK